MTKIRDKKALITGGAVRLGKEIVLELAREGVEIIVHYNKSKDEADKLLKNLREENVRSWKISADFRKKDQTKSLISRAKKRAGDIDFLINNASIFPVSKFEDFSFSELEENILVNSWAPFQLSRSFVREFDSGKIVNILDTRIKGYDWNHAAYILSKKMLAQLTRMMALQYAPKFSVNGISPGIILPPEDADESFFEKYENRIPLHRRGHPADIAQTVLFLLKSEFITGEIISIDGGRHLLREKDVL